MKNLLVASSCLIGSLCVFAAPTNPMDNYTPSTIKKHEVQRLWNSLDDDVKGKDCYKRAYVWSYDLYRNYSVKSSKIFIHYTDKFNHELDDLGGLGWFKRKRFKADGLSKRNRNMVRYNIKWNYHVAPMINVEGKNMVLDRYLDLAYDAKFPYSEAQAWKLVNRPATVNEWVEALTIRGEILYEARRKYLIQEIKENKVKAADTHSESKRKKYLNEIKQMRNTMTKLGMDKNEKIDIKCRLVTSMAEVDAAQKTEWCFYSYAPMYYYSENSMRYLTYGNIPGQRYNSAFDPSLATEENFRNGRDYIQTRFNTDTLEDALKEFKNRN